MKRIYFRESKDCLSFFEEARKNYSKKSWKSLANIVGTNRSVLNSYRYRELCIPENRFLILLNKMGKDKKEYFLNVIEIRNRNWGQIIGGKKAYIINKEEFNKGRKKARKIRMTQVKYNFDINIPLSIELCELIGVIIGDGFTNKYNTLYQTQITGHRRLDSNYYHNVLIPICKKIFNICPKIIENDNFIRLNIYSKRLFEMLTKRFGIPSGKKCYTITIPIEIINAKKEYLNATLRGMFNADGGIGFDKRKKYKKPYIRVNYTSTSELLIKQIHEALLNYSINHSIHKKDKSYMIQINGKRYVRLFLAKIGFSNKRHLDRLKYL
ncbi:MAG: LAGLIDADG family homing endonuclease [Candidatus Woesearchaeota archaeon]